MEGRVEGSPSKLSLLNAPVEKWSRCLDALAMTSSLSPRKASNRMVACRFSGALGSLVNLVRTTYRPSSPKSVSEEEYLDCCSLATSVVEETDLLESRLLTSVIV